MKIKHYLYNAFTIEEGKIKIAIDPGQNLWMFKKRSLIPESDWAGITHLMVTHGDPDHFTFAVKLAKSTGAEVICGEGLAKDFISEGIMRPHAMAAGESLNVEGLKIEGLKAHHGPLLVKMLGGAVWIKGEVKHAEHGGREVYLAGIRLKSLDKPLKVFSHGSVKLLWGLIRLEKDNLDFARGSIGFRISLNNKTIVNLGDTLLLDDWQGSSPDVLMLPIGGGKIANTMDVQAGLKAVERIKPGIVIPCHYNVPFGFNRNISPADDIYFKKEAERMGFRCRLMRYDEETVI